MKQSFLSLMLAGLTLGAGSYAVTPGETRIPVPVPLSEDLDILVNGTPQPRYAHGGRWYVEALKGREYAIRIRNPYPVRAAVALSVDGLNTIDARHTAARDARKWVLGPYESITIYGWQVSSTEARRFEFTTEPSSYAQALGKGANLGVISAVFFRERGAAIATETVPQRDARRESPASPVPLGESAAEMSVEGRRADQEYAATGMGQRTGHAVTQIQLDLERTPAQTINIRYEFRPQLVRLGILPAAQLIDPLQRRERARGFEGGFSPEVR